MGRKTYIEHEPGAKTSNGSRPRAEGTGRGIVLLTLPAFLPSVISSLFIQYTGWGVGPPGPSPRSATEDDFCLFKMRLHLRCTLKSGKWIPSTMLHIEGASLVKRHARYLNLHSLRSSDGHTRRSFVLST